ncbi:MAG: DUF4868 domain-containing protein [Ruminococcaceae bacterium]|nr:DUF4868 domain-containing protein [Oscillospiraceae bacterium]
MQIYLVLKQAENYAVKLADIEDDRTAPVLKKMFTERLYETIVLNDDLQVCQLSTTEERANTIYNYDYDTYPEELDIIKNFNINNAIDQYDKFSFVEDDLKNLYGYIIYLGRMQNGVVLFKKHYPISLIQRDSFLLGALKSKERFEMVSGDDIIRLNGVFQIICIDGELYVCDLQMLERNMGFTKLIQAAAEDTINSIGALGLLEDIEVLRDSADNLSFARKLSKVKKSSPIFRLGISKEAIIEFTKKTPELSGRFKYSETGTEIRLDTKKSKEAFIKLMNDAFLRSELTKQYYEASAKDHIEALIEQPV